MMSGPAMKRRLLTLALGVLLSAGAARAQSDAAVASEALFDDARQLMKLGNYAEACAKFAESQRLDAGVGTLIYLADCYEKSGRLASAWVTFREAAAAARVAGQAEREKLARDRSAALEPKLSRIQVEVPPASAVSGLEIRRDDAPVSRALWGSAVPVDAGTHTIFAAAPGRTEWSQTVDVAEAGATIRVEVPVLEPKAVGGQSPARTAPKPTEPVPGQEAPASHSSGELQRIGGWVVAGVGAVVAGAGAYFWQRGQAEHEEALTHCRPVCDDTAHSLQADAKRSTTVGNVAVLGGAAMFATGIILVVTAPATSAEARIGLESGVAGASVRGVW
jgi:tetratricopeptide (TPR) repeat protein